MWIVFKVLFEKIKKNKMSSAADVISALSLPLCGQIQQTIN